MLYPVTGCAPLLAATTTGGVSPLLAAFAARRTSTIVANLAAAQAVTLFQNVRTPAVTVAVACVPMGFGFPLPTAATPEEERRLGIVRRLNVVIGFLSLASELLALCISTNAINRLSQDAQIMRTDEQSTKSVMELLLKRPYASFYAATYAHFTLGVIGAERTSSTPSPHSLAFASLSPLIRAATRIAPHPTPQVCSRWRRFAPLPWSVHLTRGRWRY